MFAAQNSHTQSTFNSLRAANIPILDFQPIVPRQFVNLVEDGEESEEDD